MDIYSYMKQLLDFLTKKKREIYIKGLIKKGLKLGKNVGIVDTFFFDPSHCFLISIGDNCIICPNVRLIAHDASTKKILGYTKIGQVEIGENCFLGDSVIVLPNVRIGPNSIIGAGSVVTRDIPPGVIASGNPIRVLSTIDDYKMRMKKMMRNQVLFNEEYLINNLDNKRRQQVLEATKASLGFLR